jgi:uncharacterized RDD family membrane protein YckC
MHNTGLLRRLGAMIYDGLLLVALMFLATLPFIALRGGEPVEPGELIYQIVLFVVSYLFFVGFWSRSGRTLGMQAWRIQVKAMSGDSPSITALNVRFFTAIVSLLVFGMGFWWQLFDREGLTWHDRLSRTRLRYYPKPEE